MGKESPPINVTVGDVFYFAARRRSEIKRTLSADRHNLSPRVLMVFTKQAKRFIKTVKGYFIGQRRPWAVFSAVPKGPGT